MILEKMVVVKVVSLAAAGVLLIIPETKDLGIWALFFNGALQLVTNYINRRNDRQDAEQRHRWEAEDRERKAAEVKLELLHAQTTLRNDIKENTNITVQAATKADQAYVAANDVNDKISKLNVPLELDTNKTVHAIDAKV